MTPIYLDATQDIDSRVRDLLSRMTLEEKVGQMCQYLLPSASLNIAESPPPSPKQGTDDDSTMQYSTTTKQSVPGLIQQGYIGSILSEVNPERIRFAQSLALKSRLGIPLMFGIDAIHGNAMDRDGTVFPAPINLAATFDTNLAMRVAQATAREMRLSGLHWTFSPNVDVMRDGRWGRVGETFGEDPYLVGKMGAAMITGYQGDWSDSDAHVLSCAKHYIAGGEPNNGRNFAAMDMSERALREVFLPPFAEAVKAGVGTIMAAHNEVNGIPCHANTYLLTNVLQEELQFSGFIVSDFTDVHRLHTLHRVATSIKEADRIAVEAGIDMHMHGPGFHDEICELVRAGVIPEERIDAAASKILAAKFRLHLFEKPYAPSKTKPNREIRDEHQQLALEVAQKSIVLLKNDRQILPLDKNVNRVFITGPNAHSQSILGDWSVVHPDEDVVTILEGIQHIVRPSCEVDYLDSGGVLAESKQLLGDATKRAKNCDVAIIVVGENPIRTSPDKTEGENVARASLALPGRQLELVKAVAASGTPVIVIFVSARPIAEPWIAQHADAILNVFHPGNMGGQAVADVLFGIYNPGARLPYTIPYSAGHVRMIYNERPADTFRKFHRDANEPLYPFGYGLSYTTFRYGKIAAPEGVRIGDELTLSIPVTNKGNLPGDEVVIVYSRDMYASVTRPVKEVLAFTRVTLAPGETKVLSFTIDPAQFGLYDVNVERVIEPGAFEIYIGPEKFTVELVE